MNTTELLALAAAIVPEREALIFEGRRFSFAILHGSIYIPGEAALPR